MLPVTEVGGCGEASYGQDQDQFLDVSRAALLSIQKETQYLPTDVAGFGNPEERSRLAAQIVFWATSPDEAVWGARTRDRNRCRQGD